MTETKNLGLGVFLKLVKIMRSLPWLHKAIWRVRKLFNRCKRLILVNKPIVDAGPLIEKAIETQTPFAAGKMGSIEAKAMQCFLRAQKQKKTASGKYNAYIFHSLYTNSGVFPQTAETYDRFAEEYLEAVSNIDALVAWDVAGEAEVLKKHATKAALVSLYSLDSFLSAFPWTRRLEGKRVLVISPFVESIKAQYSQRERLWKDQNVLPSFALLTIKAPFSAGISAPQDSDWFAATKRLKKAMDSFEYDVVLVGAGAFSLPLVAHAKSQGKVGVHLGGSLPLLFGVYGQRSIENGNYRPFINDAWVRPSDTEKPASFKSIENGCYW